jgi:hypothetical protein
LAAPEKKGCFPCIPGIPLRRSGSEEKTALHSLVFLGASPCIPRLCITPALYLHPLCRLQATPKRPRCSPRGEAAGLPEPAK